MSNAKGVVKAPFTEEQVASLQAFQGAEEFHPFTCGCTICTDHSSGPVLVVTKDGFRCPQARCSYEQDWAHAWMADWSWKKERESMSSSYPDAVVLLLYEAFSEDTKRASFYSPDAGSVKDFREWLEQEEDRWQHRQQESYELVMLRLYREQEAEARGRRPTEAFPVGTLIRDELRERRMSIHELAERIQVPYEEAIRLIANRSLISFDIAQRLGDVFGTSAKFWSNMDQRYREWLTVDVERFHAVAEEAHEHAGDDDDDHGQV